MNGFRLLIVEDNEQDIVTCRDSVARYSNERKRDIQLVECRTMEEAFQTLDNSFDGAIIDLRLNHLGNEGNEVIQRIVDLQCRIPIAILTGTPDSADPGLTYIGVFKKGEIEYGELLDKFWGIHNSGVTRIVGGRGAIEERLSKVFFNNLLPQIKTWIAYGDIDPIKSEKALLRYTLNHLLQLLDEDAGLCFPEECYIYPPFSDGIRTGNIVRIKGAVQLFVVLNPACDLVIRENGEPKTDRILLIEIESTRTILDPVLEGENKKSRESRVKRFLDNNYSDYYHWLPATDFFEGGFLNFRNLRSLSKDEFRNSYEPHGLQISPSFVKDIVARFSSYYARQGQPDIECGDLVSKLATPANLH